ncbi:MAG TPA: class I SAM-dependent methyltransferase [Usitatibacter sp.]|jgi:ubiquinone/menaquinone biosynthesis C-methylase UbiE|nr:class I SAM-dependent methyltransferase [Usitatibacter sp.]
MPRKFAMAATAYHRQELRIALDRADQRRAMPPIGPHVRSILDVGCGAGQTLIASRLHPDVLAVGMDPDVEALRLGRTLDPRLRLVCAIGERLPFRSNTFDLVISRVALPYMKIRHALREMARVLRPGGRIWFLLHRFQQVGRELLQHLRSLKFKPVLHRVYVMGNGLLMNAFGIEVPSPANGRYESFQTAYAMRRELRRLGFRDLAIDSHGEFAMSAVKAAR